MLSDGNKTLSPLSTWERGARGQSDCLFLFSSNPYFTTMLRFRNFGFIFLLALFAGCSNNVSLKGTVTFSDDGSPLTQGTIGFRKDGRIARGDIKKDGTFVVGFEKDANGLPPGVYDVFLTGTEIVTMVEKGVMNVSGVEQPMHEIVTEPQILPKYMSADTSGLTFEVTAATKSYDIKVDRFKK